MKTNETGVLRRTGFAWLAGVLVAATSHAQEATRPTVDEDGTIHGALTVAPISSFLSPQAKAALTERLREPPGATSAKDGIDAIRKSSDERAKVTLDGWLRIYPSNIEDTTIDGVHVYIVTPKAGVAPANRSRVLINAHMGGFITGGRYGGLEEAVPLSGRGRIKVIALDYRMSPEYTYPAASEDMEAVYRYTLKTSKPSAVGIYGCSAGGTLVAESMAWFQKKDLPRPGAISIMCSGAMKSFWFGGDSALVSPLLNASLPMGPPPAVKPANAPRGYFDGINTDDPLITPGEYPRVLAQFPPTLVVSGTRDLAMSNAVMTYTALLKAGVEAQLFIQEGLGHGHFFAFPGTPESTDAYNLIWKFFDTHLTH
jgi:acetyl esterase/lipase